MRSAILSSLLAGLSVAAVLSRDVVEREPAASSLTSRASGESDFAQVAKSGANTILVSTDIYVPTVTPPSGISSSQQWFLAMWPAIGDGHTLFQAGIYASGTGNSATKYQYFYAFGFGYIVTTGFEAVDAPRPGDTVTVLLELQSGTQGNIYISNSRTKQSTTITVTAQSGYSMSLTSNSMLVDVETTGQNFNDPPAPGFSDVLFSNAEYYNSAGAQVKLRQNGPGMSQFNMVYGGKTISSISWAEAGAWVVERLHPS